MKKKTAKKQKGNFQQALTSKEIVMLLHQQETKVRELAKLIKMVPWTEQELDTDSTVPFEKFPTPITILTGGDWWDPDYHFMDGQGDNAGILPKGVLSVMKIHAKDVYKVELEKSLAKSVLVRKIVKKAGGKWGPDANIFTVSGTNFLKVVNAAFSQ
jgi:hypothetical protein